MKQIFTQYGYGLFAVDELKTGQFIGFIGFHHLSFDLGFSSFIEIVWRLKKQYWGKGLATEGAQKCLKFGFNQLAFKSIYSFTTITNVRSERVMQKIGMKKVKTFEHPHVALEHPLRTHVLYRINEQ